MEYTAPSVPSFRSPSPSSMSWGSIPSALSPTASKSHFYSTGGLISVLGLLLDFINLLTVIVEKNLTELTFFFCLQVHIHHPAVSPMGSNLKKMKAPPPSQILSLPPPPPNGGKYTLNSCNCISIWCSISVSHGFLSVL